MTKSTTTTPVAKTPEGPAPVTGITPLRYVTPAISELGTVTGVTLGHAGSDKRDDTQYYSSW